MVTEDGVDGATYPRADERVDGAVEQARVARRVEVGPVIEGVGVARELDAVVAVLSAARMDGAALERGEGVLELIALRVVDQVAALDNGVRFEVPDRCDRPREHPRRQGLVRAEGRFERRAQTVEEGRARGGGGVEHVGVGDVRERRYYGRRRGFRGEVRSCYEVLAGSWPEDADFSRVAPRALERRAGRRRLSRAATTACRRE